MRELFRMVFVLAVICGCSGLVLSYVNEATQEQREYQLLKYVQEPSIKEVLREYEYTNDPIQDRMTMVVGEDKEGNPIEKTIFLAKKDGKVIAVSFSESASGYGGDIDIMVGIDMQGNLAGISVMTHSETPGLGARITQEAFRSQFRGIELKDEFKLSTEGGDIDGISGATFSSKGVVKALNRAVQLFPRVKEEVS
ncbi:MAG: RnfABCDGE type electron transport complex subunit G [Desulfobacteraceae bacterium]